MTEHLVIAEYSYGLDPSEAVLRDDAAAALAERDALQADADAAGVPVRFRVFTLTEISRGHVPTNEVLDFDDDGSYPGA